MESKIQNAFLYFKLNLFHIKKIKYFSNKLYLYLTKVTLKYNWRNIFHDAFSKFLLFDNFFVSEHFELESYLKEVQSLLIQPFILNLS